MLVSQSLNPKRRCWYVEKQTLKRMNVEIPSGLSVARGARKSEAACRLARECASRQATSWERTDSGHVRRSEDCKGQSRMLGVGPESASENKFLVLGQTPGLLRTSFSGKPRAMRVLLLLLLLLLPLLPMIIKAAKMQST